MRSSASKPSLYTLAGEQLQRRWLDLQQWDMAKTKISLSRLTRLNEKSRKPVRANGPIVSLTTYGRRIQAVHLTIESIAAGTLRPSRLILWLDDEPAFRNLPNGLKRLQDRGLEILLSENFGPHTKYFPYLQSTNAFDTPLVTADDDTVYAASWLHGLAHGYAENPTVVSCYRAHEIRFSGEQLAPYVAWGRCRTDHPAYRNFGTGVSGCLYPPAFLSTLKAMGRQFEQVCPKADDLWLHVNAIRAGYKIRQVHPWQINYPVLPDTQDMGLAVSNVHAAQNDAQIQATYTAQDLALLRS